MDHKEEIKAVIFQKDKFFVKLIGNKKVVIASSYHNKQLTPNYIPDMLEDLEGNEDLIQLNIYGYPFGKTGGEYAKTYDEIKHVQEVYYESSYPLHFTMDFNVNPYMSGLVSQIVPCTGLWNGHKEWVELRFLAEYALETPHNSAGHLGEHFILDWEHLCDYGLYIYGDASGLNSIPIKNRKNLFDDLLNAIPLELHHELRVPPSNPRYKNMGAGTLGRRNFTILLFAGKRPVRILIHPKCVRLRNDLEFCQEDANGKLAKPKDDNGVELLGHHLQAAEYLYCHKTTFLHHAKIRA